MNSGRKLSTPKFRATAVSLRNAAGKAVAAGKAKAAPHSRYFEAAQRKAASIVGRPDQLQWLARTAQQKRFQSGPMAEFADEFKALLRLIRAYARGEYRDVSLESMVTIVGAVLYVVLPVDVIADFLPGGLLDDAAVLAMALKTARQEIDAFLAWERIQGTGLEYLHDLRRR